MIRLDFPEQECSFTLIGDENGISMYTLYGTYEFKKIDIDSNYHVIRTLSGEIVVDFQLLTPITGLTNFFKKSSYWRDYYTIHLEFDDYAKVVEQLKKWKYGTI